MSVLEGIDVSHHQASTPSLAGLGFLIARATYGTIRDDRYRQHVQAARAAGLVVGAYHFGRHGQVGAQVASFLEAAGTPDLLALDVEADGGATPMAVDEARTFVEACQSAGRTIGLYHSSSGYPDVGQDWRWVADYRPVDEPPIAWDVWQYTSSGGRLDRDRFRGTTAELLRLGRKDSMDIDVTDRDALLVDLVDGTRILNPDGSPRLTLDGSRHDVVSPFATTSDGGGTRLRAIIWTRADPTPDLLLAVYANAVHNPRPLAPPAIDRDAVLDEAASAVAALKGAQP